MMNRWYLKVNTCLSYLQRGVFLLVKIHVWSRSVGKVLFPVLLVGVVLCLFGCSFMFCNHLRHIRVMPVIITDFIISLSTSAASLPSTYHHCHLLTDCATIAWLCRPHGNKSSNNKQAAEPTAEEVYLDMILSRHARKLLSSNQLSTLGSFAANTDDFHLVSWLKRER